MRKTIKARRSADSKFVQARSSNCVSDFTLAVPFANAATVEPDKRIERWLRNELAGYPIISNEIARVWLEEGRIAALFDGLDEVDDSYRGAIAALLNATYLRDHPNEVVVVGSRINEYRPLQDDKSTTLNLNGSITLQPFTRAQISEYLNKVGATGLSEVLFSDETLYQIAQTPLTLSMLTLAYSGAGAAEIPSSGSFTERRHRIMERYVAKMLQRNARRERGVQFDENPYNDIPVLEYPYVPDRLNHYLGWLAIRLSVRMQTAVSPNKMYSFLERQIDRDHRSGVWWARILARSPLMFILAAMAAATVAPMTYPAWLFVSAALLLSIASYFMASLPLEPDDGRSATVAAVRNILAAISILAVVGAGAGTMAIALSLTLPGAVPPIPAGAMGICVAFAIFALLLAAVDEFDTPAPYLFAVGTMLALVLAIVLHDPRLPWYGWYSASALVVVFQVCFGVGLAIKDDGPDSWPFAGGILGVVVGAILFLAIAVWTIGNLSWQITLSTFLLLAALILALVPKPALLLAGLTVSLIIGHHIAGSTGAILAMVVYGLLVVAGLIAIEEFSLETQLEMIVERAEDAAERCYNLDSLPCACHYGLSSYAIWPLLQLWGRFTFA